MITVAPAHFPGSSTESGGGMEIRCKEEADDMCLGIPLIPLEADMRRKRCCVFVLNLGINLSYSCLW